MDQPHFWFRMDQMSPSRDFEQRRDSIHGWLPPRRRGSNVLDESDTWYEYSAGHTRTTNMVGIQFTHYKTYSFYFSNGFMWIYTSDASRYQVGDGSGNPRIGHLADQGGAAEESENGSDTSDVSDGSDGELEDWRPLSFTWPNVRNNVQYSYATIRGDQPRLRLQRPDQTWLQKVFPDRYLPLPLQMRTASRPDGSVAAELPILIALVAFSAGPPWLHHIIPQCIRGTYQPHTRPRGEGWINRRGLVVRVYREIGNDEVGAVPAPAHPAAIQRLAVFEQGGWPGYGKFFA